MEGIWMPVYMYHGNKFIIIGNPAYDTEEEAKGRGVADGISLMTQEEVSVISGEAYAIPFTEEESEWMVNADFPNHQVAIFAGPIWDEEIGDEN